MKPALKSEFRKLLTVRSTYFITFLIIFLPGLFTYLGTGPIVEQPAQQVSQSADNQPATAKGAKNSGKTEKQQPPKIIKNLPSGKLIADLEDSIQPITLLISIIVILLMAHEYRYNTITYTLSRSNSRSKILASKVIVSVTASIILASVAMLITIAAAYAAVSIKGLTLPFPDINWVYVMFRLFSYSIAFSLLALAFITLLRNLTAGIVAIFMLPTVEAIFSNLMLNHNIEPSKYLPFSALNHIVNVIGNGGVNDKLTTPSVLHTYAIFGLYFIPLWIITWYLFLRRDAT